MGDRALLVSGVAVLMRASGNNRGRLGLHTGPRSCAVGNGWCLRRRCSAGAIDSYNMVLDYCTY
jgi:hypothetical protein